MSLRGRKILVVRPRLMDGLGEDQFIEKLLIEGAEPLHYPVVAIVPFAVPEVDMPDNVETQHIKQQILELPTCAAAIFVSRPAAYLGIQWINHCFSGLSGIHQLAATQCYAVGDSTAAVLAAQGIDVITPLQVLDSEGLLSLSGLQQLMGQSVLILRGCGGRELLADTLHKRGATVHCVELYRRQPLQQHQQQIKEVLQSGVLDAVVVHSGELLKALLALLPTSCHGKLHHIPLLVSSQRIENMAQQAGFQRIVVSRSALPESMVSALSRWYINAD